MKKFLSVLLSLVMLLLLAVPAAAADSQTAVDYVIEQAYMVGRPDGFDAEGTVTRAEACQALYNLAGRPSVDAASFQDVSGRWYAAAAAWAEDSRLVSGEVFHGSAALTGEEVTAMARAYAATVGRVIPESAVLSGETVTRSQLAELIYSCAPWDESFTEIRVTVQNSGRAVEAVVTMPDGDGPFPAVVMNHGHGGSKDEGKGFAGVAQALAEAGIASIRMDFPGCGESAEPFTEFHLNNMISDSNACRDYLVKNYNVDADHLGILGYSMGGRVTSMILGQGDSGYRAAVLLAGAVGDGQALADFIVGGAEKYAEAYAEAAANGYYTITTQYGQVQDLSKDWFDSMVASDALANADRFTGPVLVMYGDQDTVVPPEINELSLAAYPQTEEIIVTGSDHSYGFYSDQPELTAVVESGIADFFAENLAAYTERVVTISVPEQDGVPAHEVIGTLTLPADTDAPVPAVVMLHGTGSKRDEVGNGYAVAAPIMAQAGLASLRIDFMGFGDSTASDVYYSPTSANIDAKAAADYLAGLSAVDSDAIGVMGWSQGGMNALLAGAAYPETFKAIVTWAGATGMASGTDFAERYEIAKRDGYTVTEYDWREPMHVGLRWYEDMSALDVLAQVATYSGPILAVQGTADTVVVPETAGKIIAASSNADSKTYMIEGCDHTYNVFSGDYSAIEEAAAATAAYFLEHLSK